MRLPESKHHGWEERMYALRNVPPVMRIFWDSAPSCVSLSLVFRLITALLPLGALLITRLIINGVVAYVSHSRALPKHFWLLVVGDFALAGLSVVLTRAVDYLDEVLAGRFTMSSSLRIMKHAAELDLASYEDPNFYDQLERARVQAIDRVSMIRAVGQLIQQSIVAVSLAASVFLFSPWLVVILVGCVVPAFLGETHYAFQGYALRFRQTPIRRRLDYLRTLASSKESAKEAKLFGLGRFFTSRYDTFSQQVHQEDVSLARRKLVAGSLLGLASTACYYGCYAFVIYRTVTGHLSVGDMTFLAGAIAGTSTNIQAIFSTPSGLADQALFLGDLIRFFSIGPQIRTRPDGRSVSMAVILPLLLVPATGAAIDIVNQLIALLFPPRVLPKLDLSKGIPDDCVTVAAVPTLLLNESQTRQMVEALEVRFLGNRDKNLHFALLTDSVDSRNGPADEDNLIRLCSQLIERLNRKYAQQSRGAFFHFHRRQVYCASEGTWMGWERKRGKLLDFNGFLRAEHDAFSVKTGALALLKDVRYVITLDSDTQLPRDAARKLIGTLAHPLNRAVFDRSGKRLQRGYAILQPKAGVDLQSARKSRLAAIFSADATFDVYTRAVSDAYQDLFGEGSFVGKGIYDIDAFHRLVDTWLPEGVLLSHDMIEGCVGAEYQLNVALLDHYGSAAEFRPSDGCMPLAISRLLKHLLQCGN